VDFEARLEPFYHCLPLPRPRPNKNQELAKPWRLFQKFASLWVIVGSIYCRYTLAPFPVAIGRVTDETTVRMGLGLDGTGRCEVSTAVTLLDPRLHPIGSTDIEPERSALGGIPQGQPTLHIR
jgi:hypothetical protein